MDSSIKILNRDFKYTILYPYTVVKFQSGKDTTTFGYNTKNKNWRINHSHFQDNPSLAKETNRELLKFAQTSNLAKELEDMAQEQELYEESANLLENIIKDIRKFSELQPTNGGFPEHILKTILYLLEPPQDEN